MDINAEEQKAASDYFAGMSPIEDIYTEANYCIFRCESKVTSPLYPRKACCKQYRVSGRDRDVEGEVRILLLLRNLQLQNIQTTRYLHHYISKDRLRLYFDSFDSVLSSKLGQGRQILEEMDLWHRFYTLSRTLSRLHEAGIYHRNLTPDAIFIRGGELYIGNFDDGIELPNGASLLQATRRGYLTFLSPQMIMTQEHPDMYTYSWAKKEDAWALGRVIFEMATVCSDGRLKTLFPSEQRSMEESQIEVDKYVRERLQGKYSHYLIEAILILLQVDQERRPSLQDFFHSILPKFYHETACLLCREPVRRIWPCAHIFCDQCYFKYLCKHQQVNQIKHCSCPGDIDEALIRLLPPLSRFIACGIRHLQQPCLRNCGAVHSMMRYRHEELVPRYIRCICGASYCSFCQRLEEHAVFRVKRVCSQFKTANSR